MKRLLILAFVSSAIIAACNNEGSTSSTQKDSSAETPKSNNTTTPTTNDTSSATKQMGNGSMMEMMHKNMADMKAMQSSGDPDHDFASMMKTHHLGAIEMAQMELSQGTDAELKQMAQKMVDDQQKEVAEFSNFLSDHQPASRSNDAFAKKAMDIMGTMKMDMSGSGSADIQFAQMMIAHHQSAIDMSNAYLKSGAKNQRPKTMAHKIITEQQKEIGELQNWLNKHK